MAFYYTGEPLSVMDAEVKEVVRWLFATLVSESLYLDTPRHPDTHPQIYTQKHEHTDPDTHTQMYTHTHTDKYSSYFLFLCFWGWNPER